eukprot:TRINITY_DN1699_c0_g1_i1.p1 TRINITY_DN1699_c0_g1~~TRINITY_DN1699_c0_g1_i1.p1  ORF type:complete len:287 (-),score=80.30 TRINITY_DN1699_c0_g1_i1:27-797(-)
MTAATVTHELTNIFNALVGKKYEPVTPGPGATQQQQQQQQPILAGLPSVLDSSRPSVWILLKDAENDAKLNTLFDSMKRRSKHALPGVAEDLTSSVRGFLQMMKERGYVDDVLTVSALAHLFADEATGEFDVEQELTYADFVEAIARCAVAKRTTVLRQVQEKQLAAAAAAAAADAKPPLVRRDSCASVLTTTSHYTTTSSCSGSRPTTSQSLSQSSSRGGTRPPSPSQMLPPPPPPIQLSAQETDNAIAEYLKTL